MRVFLDLHSANESRRDCKRIEVHDRTEHLTAIRTDLPAKSSRHLHDQASHVHSLERPTDRVALAPPLAGVLDRSVQRLTDLGVAEGPQQMVAIQHRSELAYFHGTGRVVPGVTAPADHHGVCQFLPGMETSPQEIRDVLGRVVHRGVVQEPRIETRQSLAVGDNQLGGEFRLVDYPVIAEAAKPLLVPQAIDLANQAVEKLGAVLIGARIGQLLSSPGIDQGPEGVVLPSL
jgi:hypothetical protein